MKQYRSADVQKYFTVSSETARQWAKVFARHLDVLGAPPRGRHRVYSEQDMQVFATVATLKASGLTFNEIHASLDNGTLVEFKPDDNELAAPAEIVESLQDEVQQLQARINRLEGENSLLREMLAEKEEALFEAKHRLKVLTEGKED